jgi:hypothetical protein
MLIQIDERSATYVIHLTETFFLAPHCRAPLAGESIYNLVPEARAGRYRVATHCPRISLTPNLGTAVWDMYLIIEVPVPAAELRPSAKSSYMSTRLALCTTHAVIDHC